MGASDPPPEHHSGVLEFCGGMMLNKLQNGNEGTTLIKEDRISHLPDHILGEILAFIPLKDAVATSVLSRRWRRVFTWVTYLNLDDTPNCHDYCLMRTPHMIDSFPNFKMYVDKVLQLCHSNNMDISTYILHFGKRKDCFHNVCFEGCLPVLDPMHLDAWISFPLACGVKVLDIIARVRKPSKIPSALYRCPTLEVLKLDVNVNNLDLNISFRIHLPNLKVIHLTFLKHTPNDDSVAMLVASCPSLQDLVLNAECFININLITSQSLRRLVINFSGNTWIDITSFTTKRLPRREFELDVPNLEHLTYVDSAVVIYSITKMNNLVNAQVDVTDLYFDGSIFGIFSGLSNVQSLYLMSRTTNTMALMACGTIINLKLPLFGNLKHLQLGCEGYYNWNNVLIELLHRAPFLETLTFMEGIMMDNDVLEERYREIFLEECEAWSKSEEIPSCLRVQLKRITIYNYYCTQWEMEVVKYFLRNSFVLEELILICFSHPSFSVTKEAKMLLDNTLKLMRRRSTSCSIIVK